MNNENFLALIYRRYTHFIYNKKHGNFIRFPGWQTTIVIYLYGFLPIKYFDNSGHEGIIRVGFNIFNGIRKIYHLLKPLFKMLKFVIKFILNVFRNVKAFLRDILPSKNKIHKIPVSSKSVVIENKIVYQGFDVVNNHLYLYFEKIKQVKGNYLFFIHLYPENMNILNDESKENGLICLDFWPNKAISEWEKNKTITEFVALSNVPSGYYKIKIGIYDSVNFERMNIEESPENYIDLGWKKI